LTPRGTSGKNAGVVNMTTANKITIFRILLIPFFVMQVLYYVETGREWHRWLALLSFALAAVSDGIDGYIARRYNQRSELGALLDPLADKLLLVSGIILLSWRHAPHLDRLPLWLTVTVLSRDFLLLLGLGLLRYMQLTTSVRPAVIGKVATVLQMTCVLWALLKWPSQWLFWIALAAALCTGISGLIYILEGMHRLGTSPASSASGKNG
jgi:CDP-diacylglycerol--glycerol-3-phosphate 3-phosphatidyltransferase